MRCGLAGLGWAGVASLLGSLSRYLGAALFGMASAIGCLVVGGGVNLEVLVEPPVGVLRGSTITGFLFVLWPRTYATHLLLDWVDSR